jgi:hypothetical protein
MRLDPVAGSGTDRAQEPVHFAAKKFNNPLMKLNDPDQRMGRHATNMPTPRPK